jgi:hypothetical protein
MEVRISDERMNDIYTELLEWAETAIVVTQTNIRIQSRVAGQNIC